MLPIIISRTGEFDISNAYAWYEQQSPGLGDEFILCLDAVLHSIARDPQIYQVVHRNVRRGILKRFPYSVFFVAEAGCIQVLAVFHVHRKPIIWDKE